MFCCSSQMILFSSSLLKGYYCSTFSCNIFQKSSIGFKSGGHLIIFKNSCALFVVFCEQWFSSWLLFIMVHLQLQRLQCPSLKLNFPQIIVVPDCQVTFVVMVTGVVTFIAFKLQFLAHTSTVVHFICILWVFQCGVQHHIDGVPKNLLHSTFKLMLMFISNGNEWKLLQRKKKSTFLKHSNTVHSFAKLWLKNYKSTDWPIDMESNIYEWLVT